MKSGTASAPSGGGGGLAITERQKPAPSRVAALFQMFAKRKLFSSSSKKSKLLPPGELRSRRYCVVLSLRKQSPSPPSWFVQLCESAAFRKLSSPVFQCARTSSLLGDRWPAATRRGPFWYGTLTPFYFSSS